MAVLTGFLITQIPVNLTLIISFSPILFLLIPTNRFQSSLIFLLLIWIITIFTSNIWFRLILLIIGMGLFLFYFIDISWKSFQGKEHLIAPGIFTLDYFMRGPNQGQDPIFHVNSMSIVVILAIFTFPIFYYNLKLKLPKQKLRDADELKLNPIKNQIFPIVAIFSLFFLLFIYMLDFSVAGILSLTIGMDIRQAHFIQTIMIFIVSSIFLQFFRNVRNKLPILIFMIFGIILALSTFNFPFYGITYSFWMIGIFVIFIFVANSLQVLTHSTSFSFPKLWISLVFGTLITMMFYGLSTESYLLVPSLSLIVGILLTGVGVFQNKIFTINFLKFYHNNLSTKKLATIGFVVLLVSSLIFIPATTNQTKIENGAISVMTYNLHFGVGVDGFDNLDRVVEFIYNQKPSVIAFQEITLTSLTNGNGDMYSKLKESLEPAGYTGYLSQGGKYAGRNAVFSLYPIINAKTHLLKPRVVYERTLLELTLDVDSMELKIFATHVTHIYEKKSNPERVNQINNILEIIQNNKNNKPIILLGDFNSEPLWDEIKIIEKEFTDAWEETRPNELGYTWPSKDARQRIDYIFYSNTSLTPSSCDLLLTQISDHLPLFCLLSIT